MRPVSVRSLQVDGADSGDAHHDRPYHLRAFGRKARGGMKQNLQNPKAKLADTTKGRDFDMGRQIAAELPDLKPSNAAHEIAVALLTGGGDRPYVLGLTAALISTGA